MAFMPNKMANRTMIPAAASPLYSSLGSFTQANICMGSTVKRSRGDVGSKVRYTRALMKMIGAASPIARDMARMVPVSMPGRLMEAPRT